MLSGRRVLITSGPTREHLDPIRFLTNASSGRMGFALARAARALGAKVRVVTGPTELHPPAGVKVTRVETGLEMRAAALAFAREADLVIGAAAVSDWRFPKASPRKLKRKPGPLRLTLLPNPDIIKDVAARRRKGQIVVGFALETHHRVEHAKKKLLAKKLDAIVANGPATLAGGRIEATVLTRDASHPVSGTKDAAAKKILKVLETLL